MSTHANKWLSMAAVSSAAITVSLLGAPDPATAVDPPAPPGSSRTFDEGAGHAREPHDLDLRRLTGSMLAKAERALAQGQNADTRTWLAGLGPQAVVDVDPLTGTPRQLARLDGYLSGPRTGPAADVALDFVRGHLDALGLTEADLGTLRLHQDYVDPVGIHHLSWQQQVDGTPVFGNGLQVKVTKDGRVLSVLGSPVSGLPEMAERAQTRVSQLDADQARTRAAQDVDQSLRAAQVAERTGGPDAETTWSNHDYAQKVWFVTPDGLQAGWSTYVQTDQGSYQHVLGAASGRTLYRHATTQRATGDAYVYRSYPGAPQGPTGITGGKPSVVNFLKQGWLAKDSKALNGRYVVTWADLNFNLRINGGEQAPVPGNAAGATDPLTAFQDTSRPVRHGPYADRDFSTFCTARFVCTWDPQTPYSWRQNFKADQNNAFYLANTFHDYLERDKSIGFTPRAGNFTLAGGDPVHQLALAGANADRRHPGDPAYYDNAFMSTPPDGTPPIMAMFVWHEPGSRNDQDFFLPTSGSFDPSTIFHEYTHGLSNRLVIDAGGNSTLRSLQAGSMGEAWSDYYAMDYLVTEQLQKDAPTDGSLQDGRYLMGGQKDADGRPVPFRSMAIDCPVGSTSSGCFDTYNPDAGLQGGYTYGDLVQIEGSAEVHSSGEVWSQTLWDIRDAFGHSVADTLITRAMSLSAADPSMLDMRNAILQADQGAFGGRHQARLWRVFAERGMGYYAASLDGDDIEVVEDFHVLPGRDQFSPQQQITGRVTDSETGEPVPGITASVAGFGERLSGVTGPDGRYVIGAAGMFAGTYPKVSFSGAGYLPEQRSVTVPQGEAATQDLTVRRDWAMSSGGSEVSSFTGPDFSDYGCGPAAAIDGLLESGWDSITGKAELDGSTTFRPKRILVRLPKPVDVSGFGVDPGAILACQNLGSAATGDYAIQVSTDGISWTRAARGTFHLADQGRLNEVGQEGQLDGIQFVRFVIKGTQVEETAEANGIPGTYEEICGEPDNGFSGCAYADLSELAVFGTPSS